MTATALWPYLVVILAGFLPNEMFRIAAVLLSKRVDETSEFFSWIRIVATTLLAAVVSRLIYAPAASLSVIPIWIRIGSLAIGATAFFALRRSLVLAILVAETCFVSAAWWIGVR